MQEASALAVFASALVVGVSIAAPVGPIGLLVIQRTLRAGVPTGLATGLGAAVADATYGAVGAFGVAGLIAALGAVRVPLAVVGGAFLLWLAWRTWTAPLPQLGTPMQTGRRGLAAAFAGTALLTLSNPATIVSFVAVFGAFGAGASASPWTLVAGVLAGSALWWLLLCTLVGALRTRFGARAMRAVNRASALVLAAFALWQWAGLAGAR